MKSSNIFAFVVFAVILAALFYFNKTDKVSTSQKYYASKKQAQREIN